MGWSAATRVCVECGCGWVRLGSPATRAQPSESFGTYFVNENNSSAAFYQPQRNVDVTNDRVMNTFWVVVCQSRAIYSGLMMYRRHSRPRGLYTERHPPVSSVGVKTTKFLQIKHCMRKTDHTPFSRYIYISGKVAPLSLWPARTRSFGEDRSTQASVRAILFGGFTCGGYSSLCGPTLK